MSGTSTGQRKAAPKRGRPFKYAPPATTLDEAREAFYAGTLPKKPRNAFEGEIMRRKAGRRASSNCRTRQAAELANDYRRNGAMSLAEAARRAAVAYGLNDPDTVRQYARKLLRGPMVTIKRSAPLGPSWAPVGRGEERRVPLLHEVKDAT
ncbi:hypothetical protein [Azohydromonas sp.]|uniref:hypothetical protein n=1 Tax=Azohydromonas sp. TaxID=1872666 RepID=UPI002C3E86AC|nr:hypothetical protein [Azohydromonas sp.]HMM84664.1 hypothetical protein [Azohydromonas sp.]